MDVRIVVETTFEDGETQRRNIGRLCRAPDNLESESLGLRIDEAKIFLGRLQEVLSQSFRRGKGKLCVGHSYPASAANCAKPDCSDISN